MRTCEKLETLVWTCGTVWNDRAGHSCIYIAILTYIFPKSATRNMGAEKMQTLTTRYDKHLWNMVFTWRPTVAVSWIHQIWTNDVSLKGHHLCLRTKLQMFSDWCSISRLFVTSYFSIKQHFQVKMHTCILNRSCYNFAMFASQTTATEQWRPLAMLKPILCSPYKVTLLESQMIKKNSCAG